MRSDRVEERRPTSSPAESPRSVFTFSIVAVAPAAGNKSKKENSGARPHHPRLIARRSGLPEPGYLQAVVKGSEGARFRSTEGESSTRSRSVIQVNGQFTRARVVVEPYDLGLHHSLTSHVATLLVTLLFMRGREGDPISRTASLNRFILLWSLLATYRRQPSRGRSQRSSRLLHHSAGWPLLIRSERMLRSTVDRPSSPSR
jgi:hypothetical protein